MSFPVYCSDRKTLEQVCSELSQLGDDQILILKKNTEGCWIPSAQDKPRGIRWLIKAIIEKIFGKAYCERFGVVSDFTVEFFNTHAELLKSNPKALQTLTH